MMPYNTHMIEKTSLGMKKSAYSLRLIYKKNLSRNNPFFLFGNKIKYYTVKGCNYYFYFFKTDKQN